MQTLQSNAASSLHDRSLQDRCILDPGSTVHNCNKTGANWKQVRLPSSQNNVKVDCNSHRVEAWREVTLDVRRGNETASTTLKKVAYIPGFIANISSLSCCKNIRCNSKAIKLFKEDCNGSELVRTILWSASSPGMRCLMSSSALISRQTIQSPSSSNTVTDIT
jgi:hypothetical protein